MYRYRKTISLIFGFAAVVWLVGSTEVTPGLLGINEKTGTAPSNAVVLFDGTDLSKWKPSDWKIENRELIAVSGNLTTNQPFGNCQLHLEWQAPDPPQGRPMANVRHRFLRPGLQKRQARKRSLCHRPS